jgi:hypothetical protein
VATLKSDDEILAELGKASLGLLYMSESDYPFEIVRWDGDTEVTPAFLRGLIGESQDCPVQEMVCDTFLGGRYQRLAQLLKTNLSSLKVYKVGRINMPVYIVGRSPEGNWLGLSTRVVQT